MGDPVSGLISTRGGCEGPCSSREPDYWVGRRVLQGTYVLVAPIDAGVLAGMLRDAQEASERFAKEEGCTVEWSKIWSIEPIPFHPALIGFCDEAIRTS